MRTFALAIALAPLLCAAQDGHEKKPGLEQCGLIRQAPTEGTHNVMGSIALKVEVDALGNVTSAVQDYETSNSMSDELFQASKSAALKSKFKPTGAVQQCWLTYTFKL